MTATDAPAVRRPGPSLGLSITLIVIGVVLGTVGAVFAAIPLVRTIAGSAILDTPTQITRHLGAGHYRVYERDTDSTTLGPNEVRITGPDGDVTTDFVAPDTTITRGGTEFQSVLGFTIAHGGDYQIEVTADGDRVIVDRTFGDNAKKALPWLALAAGAGLLLIIGIVLAIVGAVRRSSARRLATAPAGAGFTPPGWHADPGNSGRLRYWDGSRWTDHYT